MRILYLDCFAGISGDMFLGALLDLGVDEQRLRAELAKLHLPGADFTTRRVIKQNISALKFDLVEGPADHDHHHHHGHEEHRGYTEIVALIDRSALTAPVKKRATSIFRRIGEAEAKIHGIPLERVHFHEIGALDSIVDIIGACVAIEELGVAALEAAPPPLGSGFVETAHGRFPVPAPATLELLKGLPTRSSTEPAELVTPTGAAILAEFCTAFGPLPAMQITGIGYGAGTRTLEKTPNVLRALLGESAADRRPATETDTVAVIETNIDDMNPQLFGDVLERVLAAGALDAFCTAVQMKKNRPGTLLTVLCECADVNRFAELLLTHTTSFGVRIHEAQRRKLARAIVKVATRFGEIEVKVGRLGDRVVARSPEYEACKQAALQAGVPVKDVYREAARVAEESL